MGLFDKFTIRNNEKVELKKGQIEKYPSYIMAVPKKDENLNDLAELVNEIQNLDGIKVIAKRINQLNIATVVCNYNEVEYSIDIFIQEFELPALFRISHDFVDEDIEIMENAKRGLVTKMTFGEDNLASFHLQMKILYAMVPEMAGVVDFSAEKILSGKWVELTAKSDVSPAPIYLYTVQAISDQDEVWLHTHGLNRCGSIELEIMKSDKNNFNNHYEVLSSFAERMVTSNDLVDEEEAIYIGSVGDEQDLVVTWIDYKRAIKRLKKSLLGGAKDRVDGHNENTGVIFAYPTEQDYNKKKMVHISEFNSLLNNNPIFMKTTEETNRMRQLAIERIPFLHKLWNTKEEKQVLIKVGLRVDREYDSSDNKEHIWFEVNDLREDRFIGTLMQEPYYVSNMNKGDEAEFSYEELTDWLAYTEKGSINPDSVYRIMN